MAGKSIRTEYDTMSSRGLRSPNSFSDMMSASGRSTAGGVPSASPKPAYIAESAAENLAAIELDQPTSISESALDLVNSFLDQTLYNLLSLSKSTSLPALRLAIPKLLKPRLGQAAINVAEEDLRDMIDGEDSDATTLSDQAIKPADFDLELVWKLARLRCMAYARLGDMEDEDAEEYLEQENLEEYAHSLQMSTNSNSTLFITSVLEFLGEQALCTAAQNAERRHNTTLGSEPAEGSQGGAHDSALVIETSDMMQLGREGPLSRLWRSWRRDTRVLDSFASRTNTPATMMSPNLTDQHRSRANSFGFPAQAIPEEDSPKSARTPSQIPLPMRDNDIDEIEMPGFAPELNDEQQAGVVPGSWKNERRPVSMIMIPGGYQSPPSPSSPTGPAYQERSPLRPQWQRTRSQSVPTPTQSPLASPGQDGGYLSSNEGWNVGAHGGVAGREAGTTPSDYAHDHTRAGIISGAVGAIAGALGVEAMRSSHKGGHQQDLGRDGSEVAKRPRRTVAEEIMGPSNNVPAPSDASTGASINRAGEFDSMHIPVMTKNQSGDFVRRKREVSDPEDLALSSADEENAAQTTTARPRDSGFGVAGAVQDRLPRERYSIPSSPSSPKRMNREAAVLDSHMIPMRQEDEAEPRNSQARRSMISDAYATAPTSQRYSDSHYSQPDRESTSLPIQRPVSREQRSSAWPAVVSMHGPSREQENLLHSHSTSKSSEYSHHSRHSSNSEKHQGFQRDQDGRLMSQRRAIFNHGSSSPKSGHSRGTSLANDEAAAGGVALAAAGASNTLASRRQHLRLRSDSEDYDRVDEEKKKSLEILINSDETLHYTLTPEQARPREDPPKSPTRARTQTQELADFFRSTGPPGEEQGRIVTEKSNRAPMSALRSNPPDQLQNPVEVKAAQPAAEQAESKLRNQLGAPRDARPERNTTRDLADLARSTGPATAEQLPQTLGTRPSTSRSTTTAGGLRHDGVPMRPAGTHSIESDRSTIGSNKPASRLKFQARDARPARDIETSDLIDFIREGPPRKTGEHRIDRHVAPFRTTMDSDDLNALAPPADLNGRSSVGSAQDSSVMTGRSVQESTNSRTGLLENHKPPPRVNGGSSFGAGVVRKPIPELDGRPQIQKKRRGPRDPYAIDDSDDEALEEELAKPPPRQEESLIDFLRNTAPPPGMTTQPILSAGARPEAKPDVKRSASQSRLKDVLTRQNSSPARSNGTARQMNGAREESPHLTQVGSKMDKYRPTQTTHAAHVDRNRQKPRIEPREATNVRTGTSDMADFMRNTGPPESPRPSTGQEKYVSSNVKEQAGFLKFFKQRGSVRR